MLLLIYITVNIKTVIL